MAHHLSAGILLFRRVGGRLEVLLARPGGPFFARTGAGTWTIPKGEPEPQEESTVDGLEIAARREFGEETGQTAPPGRALELGSVIQKGGKLVHAWAIEGDLDPASARSNTFEVEWPPLSGRVAAFPEVDQVAWFDPDEARVRINPAQVPFVDRLEALLAPP